jgi:polyphosphate kinase
MHTSPRTPTSRRRGPNGRFLPRPTKNETADQAPVCETADADPTTTERVVTTSIEPDDLIERDGPELPELPEDRFLNRELSWLDFNARVLALAEDQETPLLERAKFLAIFASNLDEFYMVRVAGLKRRLKAGLPMRGGDRSSLRNQLDTISQRTADLVTRQAACFGDEVRPKLSAEGIEVVAWAELDAPSGNASARTSASRCSPC